LFSTFTINLAYNIRKQLADLDAQAAERIRVVHLNGLARKICQEAGWQGSVKLLSDLEDVWADVFEQDGLPKVEFSKEEICREYSLVIDPAGIEDEDSYLTTIRSARPRLSRQERRELWKFFRTFQNALKRRDYLTPNGAIKQARLALEAGKTYAYRYVLVDEVQDLGLEALRFVHALSPLKDGSPNPLTLAGDGHQRVYGAKIPLSNAGIETRGRSRRLKVNYRTSEQIRRWAQGILNGLEIDDLDGEGAVTVGDRSAFKGPDPQIARCKTKEQETKVVVSWVKHLLEQGVETHEICITPYRPELITALEAEKIETRELQARQGDLGAEDPGVRVGSMERIKGLEFKAVCMACANSDDAFNHLEDADVRERCLRYVAATRARESLLITIFDAG
jgi:superfamily I DNA/RNA helicase